MNTHPLPKIVYLTAGAAGMFCGSCMHDNTLARAFLKLGCDVQLLPLYTPIRTDETSVAANEVFFGGINVYLQQRFSLFRYLPRWFDRLLDSPGLLRWATSRGIQTQAQELGALTVSILKAEHGHQRKEVERLVDWLAGQNQPDVLIFTNMLVAGSAPRLKKRLGVKVFVALQGDDIFLNELPEPYQSQAFTEIRRLVREVDGFLVNSTYYADFMTGYFQIPREKLHVIPLGIDTSDFQVDDSRMASDRPPTIGYLARLAPEKGLHLLVEAFIYLHQVLGVRDARLRIAGWLGEQHRAYAQAQFQKLNAAGLQQYYEHVGEVDRRGKVEFLRSLDLLSVPTVYADPKGLFVLEALAMGVPVVQPQHGAFPEVIAATHGGLLFEPGNIPELAAHWQRLLSDPIHRRCLGDAGQNAVRTQFTAEIAAQRTLLAIQEIGS